MQVLQVQTQRLLVLLVLRLKGVVPFVDFDDGDRERVMEMPNSVGFTADEAVRVHTGSDASKHSVLPSLDGKHVRVRTSRGWVSYRRQYFYVLLIRKIASIMESGGYTGAVWQDLGRGGSGRREDGRVQESG